MIFGYARISTKEQSLDMQINVLLKYGVNRKQICEKIVRALDLWKKKKIFFR